MREFLRQFRLTARQWLALGCVGGMVSIISWMGLRQNRLEYQRMLDASSLRTVARIEAAIDKAARDREVMQAELRALHDQARKVVTETKDIRKSVDQLKGEARARP